MSDGLADKLRRICLYPVKLLRTLRLRDTLRFVWAYCRGWDHLQVRFRSYRTPLWLRPRSTDIRVAHEIFSLRELDISWPLRDTPVAIIDAGANVGYSTAAMKQRWPDASVVAIEPDADNFAVLQKNTQHLRSVSLRQKPIWGTRCSLRVKPDTNSAAWSIQFEPVPEGSAQSTPSETIADLIESCPRRHCDLLKLDIEGAELSIFSQPDLAWIERVSVVVVEVHSEAAKQAVLRAADRYHLTVGQTGEKMMLTRARSAAQGTSIAPPQ